MGRLTHQRTQLSRFRAAGLWTAAFELSTGAVYGAPTGMSAYGRNGTLNRGTGHTDSEQKRLLHGRVNISRNDDAFGAHRDAKWAW